MVHGHVAAVHGQPDRVIPAWQRRDQIRRVCASSRASLHVGGVKGSMRAVGVVSSRISYCRFAPHAARQLQRAVHHLAGSVHKCAAKHDERMRRHVFRVTISDRCVAAAAACSLQPAACSLAACSLQLGASQSDAACSLQLRRLHLRSQTLRHSLLAYAVTLSQSHAGPANYWLAGSVAHTRARRCHATLYHMTYQISYHLISYYTISSYHHAISYDIS